MAIRRTECRWPSRWLRTSPAIRWSLSRKAARPTKALAWNVLTWGQYKFDFAPKVDRLLAGATSQVNISDRWNRDKTDDLQYAFFNGEGWESWENIWGIWNGITPRDAEATRRVATIERASRHFS